MGELRTVLELITLTAEYLTNQGCDSPRLDAEILLGHVLQLDRLQLYLNFDRPLTTQEVSAYRRVVALRAKRRPTAYITGTREFYSRDFCVNEGVLVPRPETELLVETAINWGRGFPKPRVLDVGTGSGVIAISLARELPGARVTGTDISPAALAVAQANADAAELSNPITFVESDLFSAISKEPFHLICSNPPYIPSKDIADLEPEVQAEPVVALDGGVDGLAVYRRLLSSAPQYMAPDGYLILEIGWNQAAAVQTLAKQAGLALRDVVTDYAGHDRVVVFCRD